MGIKFNFEGKSLSIHEKAKILLFSRWMSTNYSTSEMNGSVGIWWIQQLNFFEKEVLPEYHKNGSYKSTVEHLISVDGEEELTNHCEDCGAVIQMHRRVCTTCEDLSLPF